MRTVKAEHAPEKFKPGRRRLLASTVHGSHLYGLAHAGSDLDVYQVVLNRRSLQQIEGANDAMRLGLEDFLVKVGDGVPQALEALHSPYLQLDPSYAALFRNLRPDTDRARMVYRRTARNFALADGGRRGSALARAKREDKPKIRRHGLRLLVNLDQLVRTGAMDPVMPAGFAPAAAHLLEQTEDRFAADFELLLGDALRGRLPAGVLGQRSTG